MREWESLEGGSKVEGVEEVTVFVRRTRVSRPECGGQGGGANEVEGVGVSSSWRAAIESFNSALRPPELEVDG